MYYSSKNCNIKINNNTLLIDSAVLSTTADLTPVYDVGNIESKIYRPVGGLQGKLNLSYYLTGFDFLKSVINNELLVLSGNFNGLYFNSGYLTNFSINGTPNSPIIVNAEIGFFERVKGEFIPTIPKNQKENLINFSDVVVNTEGSFENIPNIKSFNYSYGVNIEPVYYIGQQSGINMISPDRVFIGEKSLSADIITDSTSIMLPFTGEKQVGVSFGFVNPLNNLIIDYLSCSGTLQSKTLSAKVGENIFTKFSIIENNIYNIPKILSFVPQSGLFGTTVTLSGTNFSENQLLGIGFGKIISNKSLLTNVQIISDNRMVGDIPVGVSSDYLVASFVNGTNKIFSSQSLDKFQIIPNPISITLLNPPIYSKSLDNGLNLGISGRNFYYIDKVLFGNKETQFFTESPSGIKMRIPDYAESEIITVVSTINNISGFYSGFAMPPFVSGIFPQTGTSGGLVNVTGRNFDKITGVYFGNNRSGVFTVVNNNFLTVIIPSGNTFGNIKIYNASGLSNYEDYFFSPVIRSISGNPSSGLVNTFFTLTTDLIDPTLLTRSGDGYYTIFGGATGVLYQNTSRTLTGKIPTGFSSGFVGLLASYGTGFTHPTDATFNILTTPFITSKSVISSLGPYIASGKYFGRTNHLTLQGGGFYSITGVMFSGTKGYKNAGELFTIPSSNLVIQGDRSITFNEYRVQNISTGMYDIFVKGIYGTGQLKSGITVLPAPNLATSTFTKVSGSSEIVFNGVVLGAKLARDGRTVGSAETYSSFMSNFNTNPWWELDFGSEFKEIDRIKIYASTKTTEAQTLKSGFIQIYDTNRVPVYYYPFYTGVSEYLNYITQSTSTGIFPNSITGRYLRIQITGQGTKRLVLTEVEVF